MSKLEKLLMKLYSHPRTFDFKDAKTLLHELDYQLDNKGKTSGSRIIFKKGRDRIILHKLHPRKELLPYQIKQIQDKVKEMNKNEKN
ncbi:type II toxin-antitoxin system HicA family toxin [Lactobacillus crispatus]|uniref:type II toxin-antitoxin system HicA family toxin n=1 Tax=Lactobacillus crispatus TaxID=47770 RepID=UPI0021A38096|nr:type II toxin-antitoxin system HicA family toxin [Lactobacillus crispatus]